MKFVILAMIMNKADIKKQDAWHTGHKVGYKSGYHKGYRAGKRVMHSTASEYCCACDFDLAVFASELKEERLKGKKQALNEAIEIFKSWPETEIYTRNPVILELKVLRDS